MDDIKKLLFEGFEIGQSILSENDKRFEKVEENLQSYLVRAKETLGQSQQSQKKPQKRFKRVVANVEEEEEPEPEESLSKDSGSTSSGSISLDKKSIDKPLRPLRTAKSKANQNLKEVPSNTKMRNDNNTVVIKSERVSKSISDSRESTKENEAPANEIRSSQETLSEKEFANASLHAAKRSNSVEIIATKTDSIEITDDDNEKDDARPASLMPPPAAPEAKKAAKKTRTKQAKIDIPEPTQPSVLRFTRSKIKLEKLSVDHMMPPPLTLSTRTSQSESTTVGKVPAETTMNKGMKKVKKVKYPMPILVKIEQIEDPESGEKPSNGVVNETFNVEPVNPNATVTLEKNPHDSLMTEDNDDSMEIPLANIKIAEPPKLLPSLKLKKNEVFSIHMPSPVKQKVQAFEKLATNVATPEKFKTLPPKYSTLKNGTPSKIAMYSKTTTPLSINKVQRLPSSASSGSLLTASSTAQKTHNPLKKMKSLSTESLEETRKQQQALQMMEERRKAREDKQRQAQLQREAQEKEKREQTLKTQQERDEKFRKAIKEKEEKQRLEAQKKRVLKEKQAKKFAEEKAKKEFAVPKPPADQEKVNKDDSLHLKLQKQILMEKAAQQKKAESKNVYSFDMLHTDDSTDDESRPSQKRPPPPAWSKKSVRKPLLAMQSHVNPNVLDALFSTRPISVDLREIFPSIDSRKLIRNSSAIWKTPPKSYHPI